MALSPANTEPQAAPGDAPAPRQDLDPALHEARGIVVQYRRRLDWTLHVPQFEELLEPCLEELDLPRRRQGIGLRAAADALPIQHKHAVVRWTVTRLRHLLPGADGVRLARTWDIDNPRAVDTDAHLSPAQWDDLRAGLLATLGREQRRYKRAQAALFEAFRPLVHSIVQRIVFDPHLRDDAEQEGCLALLAAIDRIGEDSGAFGAYAQAWIRRAVRNFLMRERVPVSAPVNIVSEALRGAHRTAPTRGRGNSAAAAAERLLQPSVPLDEPGTDDAPSLRDTLADAEAPLPSSEAARSDVASLIASCIDKLTGKQREVLALRFGLPGAHGAATLEEIARRIGISHQQVSMRERRALERLGTLLAPLVAELR